MRYRSFPIAIVAALLASLAACARQQEAFTASSYARVATSPITIDISCDDSVTVGLVDRHGAQAWSVEVKKNSDIEWIAGPHVASFSITPKAGDEWPLEAPYPLRDDTKKKAMSKAKSNAKAGAHGYVIRAVCSPTAGGQRIVIIDPDMIITFSAIE